MKKEFGKWFLDVAKYIFTALLLSYFFSDLTSMPLLIVVILLFLLFVFLGAYLIKSAEYGSTECKTPGIGDNGRIGSNHRPRNDKRRRKESAKNERVTNKPNPRQTTK